jgi:hypothetical protein
LAADEPFGQDDSSEVRFDSRVAHVARVYNYWLGGKDYFTADRIADEETTEVYPGIRQSARANRAFLARVVRHLALTEGIRQFLDIGTGLPTASNTHEVAQSVAPESRIVYVDNDHCKLGCAYPRRRRSEDRACRDEGEPTLSRRAKRQSRSSVRNPGGGMLPVQSSRQP